MKKSFSKNDYTKPKSNKKMKYFILSEEKQILKDYEKVKLSSIDNLEEEKNAIKK